MGADDGYYLAAPNNLNDSFDDLAGAHNFTLTKNPESIGKEFTESVFRTLWYKGKYFTTNRI